MSEKKAEVKGYRRKKIGEYQCHCCKEKKPYCLSCTCGFMICEACFQENLWGNEQRADLDLPRLRAHPYDLITQEINKPAKWSR